MPLDIQVPTEHPDVTALKQKVTEVANAYAKKHNWCGVVKEALREAGVLTPDDVVAVRIDFTVSGSDPQVATKSFKITDLVGKTEDEQKSWVASEIAPKVDVAGTKVTLPVTIIDLNVDETATVKVETSGLLKDGLVYPDGYHHFYTSQEGRVAHLVSHDRLRVSAQPYDMENAGPATYADVQTENEVRLMFRQGGRHLPALCGTSTGFSLPVRTSQRSEGRVCTNCLNSANARAAGSATD